MKNRFPARAVALVLVLSFAVAIGAAPAPERDPFKGKIVLVTYSEGNNTLKVPLEQARVQKLGERYYIVGKVVDSDIARLFVMGNCTLWIPEHNVTSIAEYESVEKMSDAYLRSGRGPLPIGDPRRKQDKGQPPPFGKMDDKSKFIPAEKRPK